MPVYEWDRDKEQIIKRLASRATLKLCVKLLDEPLFIEGWIEHHAKIVGFENLIVADNESTNTRTLEVYDRFSDLVTIFRFKGSHNEVHWHPRFAGFFDIIKRSCEYFSFVDADERIVFLGESAWRADDSIVAAISRSTPGEIIPGTWLINTLNSLDTFSLLDTESRPQLINNLKWGKPILPARLVGTQPGMHNLQFSHLRFSSELGVNIFFLHYTQFPQARIEVNRNKILSRNVIDKTASNQDIAAMNFDDHADKSLVRFVAEMKRMLLVIGVGAGSDPCLTEDFLKLEQGGEISYSNTHAREVFSEFLHCGGALINSTFYSEAEEQSQNKVFDFHGDSDAASTEAAP